MRIRGPRRVALVALTLSLAAGRILIAQTETTGPPTGPAPSELYRDVKALMLVEQLQLTTAQIQKIIPVLQMVADQARADEAADEAAWRLVQGAAQKVVAALLAGAEPPAADTAALDQAARERNQREEARAAMVASAAVQIQRMLTADQARRIETAAEHADRLASQARMEGARTPVEYLLRKLDEQIALMPDEYLRTREQRALEMAQAIEGENADVRRLAEALLGIMDEVAGWSPQEYSRQRPTLGSQLSKLLKLPEKDDENIIRYDDFIGWITSEATVPVLREFLASTKTSAGEEARP